MPRRRGWRRLRFYCMSLPLELFFSPRDLGLRGEKMIRKFRQLWWQEDGQDIAEYAVMLAVILVIVVGTVQLIGSNANNVFSSVASSLQ